MADWPSDKELEEIYRKGSEKHDFQYSSEAWADMETMLDKDKRRKKFFFMLLLSIGVVVASLMTINVFFSDSQNIESNSLTTELTHLDISAESNSSSSPQANTPSDSAKELNAQKIPSTQAPEAKINKTTTGTVDLNSKLASNTTPISNTYSLDKSNEGLDQSSKPQTTIDKENGTGLNTEALSNNLLSNSDFNNTTSINSANEAQQILESQNTHTSTNSKENNLSGKGIEPINLLSINFFEIKNTNLPPTPLLAEIEKDNAKFNRFMISGVISAESSWTPNGEFSKIDAGLGLRANYFLSNKWALSLGASYINDIYTAEKGDYKASRDFWKANGSPDYTTADCSMIEVSTGATYYFRGIDNNGFSTSVNLLSNFMIKEEYNYHFTEESNNFSSSWSMANQTWLNGLSFAANYKFNLSSKVILEAGPYAKIPLSGIGHGDVMLSSFGLRFAVGIR